MAKLFTLQRCFFHPNDCHGMALVEENGERKLVCPVKYRGEENIIILDDNGKVKEVVSPLTSLIKEKEIIKRANEYVSKLRFFNIEEIKDAVEQTFNSVINKMNLKPLEIRLQQVEEFPRPTDTSMRITINITDTKLGVERTYSRFIGLLYYKRGATVTIPSILSSSRVKVRADNYSKLRNTLEDMFIELIPALVDEFTCRTVEIVKEMERQKKLKGIVERLEKKGIEIKKDSNLGRIYYDDENNSMFPLIELSVNLEGDYRIDLNRIEKKLPEKVYKKVEKKVVKFFEELVELISKEVNKH